MRGQQRWGGERVRRFEGRGYGLVAVVFAVQRDFVLVKRGIGT